MGKYRQVYAPNHPRTSKSRSFYEHVIIAERALGKFLPRSAEVHHVDGDKLNNDPSNLVICEDREYHALLHQRQRAYTATGDPHKRKCTICKQWDDPEKLYVNAAHVNYRHVSCYREYRKTLTKK